MPELHIIKQRAIVSCVQPYHNRQRRAVVFMVTNRLVLWYSEISLTYEVTVMKSQLQYILCPYLQHLQLLKQIPLPRLCIYHPVLHVVY